jgi:phosphoglycerol transferase MdoB-like AlkP superfamily enzyme
MNIPHWEKDNEIMETLNSIQATMTGLETLKKQFFEYDLFKSVWNLGYTEGFYNLLKGIFMSDNAHNYIADENIKDAIQDLQNKMKEAQDSLQKALKDTEK